MTLNDIIRITTGTQKITVADCIDGEIYIDQKQAAEVKSWPSRYSWMKNSMVWGIETGAACGDLIIKI